MLYSRFLPRLSCNFNNTCNSNLLYLYLDTRSASALRISKPEKSRYSALYAVKKLSAFCQLTFQNNLCAMLRLVNDALDENMKDDKGYCLSLKKYEIIPVRERSRRLPVLQIYKCFSVCPQTPAEDARFKDQ